jgi:hypothetical protein
MSRRSGADDFSFLFGTWRVRNRRIVDRADPSCDAWETFDAVSIVQPLLGGFGHIDRLLALELPGGGGFEGFTLRLYEPSSDTWRIWWSDTTRPGLLDPPMSGRFSDGVGRFEGRDELDGRPVKLRFVWSASTPSGPRWEQAFSWDDGDTWRTNWVMDLSREVA